MDNLGGCRSVPSATAAPSQMTVEARLSGSRTLVFSNSLVATAEL
jgi:hypothetical protein